MNTDKMTEALKEKVLAGSSLTEEEAYSLADASTADLCSAAAEITRRFVPRQFDSCSIINVRSGRCPENCRWCAQSAHWSTGCETYAFVGRERCVEAARYNHERGVRRFSLVASGKSVKGAALEEMASTIEAIKTEVGIEMCASMGLLGAEELRRLRRAGVARYHCNLETAPSHFPTLCSTHTIDDKIHTIALAREAGMEVCSGGIIGMGETEHQRIEFALTLRRVQPVSIPMNILSPIPGTPLQDTPPISDEDILRTVALFRFIHPKASLRFAGGRARLPRAMQIQAMNIGVNGGIVGDLLTTVASKIADDKLLAEEAGYEPF